MQQVTLGATLTAAIAAGALASAASADQLPGTLNFRDVTGQKVNQALIEESSNEKEVEPGDFDNDGDLDVVIANAYSDFFTRKNKLYRNDDGVFNEISGAPAIPGFSGSDVSRNAFFRDYDNDGWLDVIIVNDANTGGDGGRTKIYMNQHPGDVFSTFNEEGQTRLGANTGGAACGAVSIDANGDNFFDLYVGNYPGPSQDTMYFNNGSGFFTEVTSAFVPVDGDYTVDVSSADLNGDGKLDLLISNHSINYAYYNDNLGAGSMQGDYQYSASSQILGNASANENAMEPGDFDNDNDQDIYWSNYSGSPGDRVFRNDGNDGTNKAVFTLIDVLPPSVTANISRKATVADLNDDGRVDVFVMKTSVGGSGGRPTVLRNTTVAGAISFVDWTPASAFPTGATHEGWHAAVFDSSGDDKPDIFLGGWADDHLFEQAPGTERLEADLVGGDLPLLFNRPPVAVAGKAGAGESDTYVAGDLGTDAFVSVVLNGADDYELQILDAADAVLATVNRGGLGVEEAIQYDPAGSPSTLKFRVNVLECASPYNVSGDCGVTVVDLLALLAGWGPNPGHPADFNGDDQVDVVDLLDLLAAWADSDYILDILSRSG